MAQQGQFLLKLGPPCLISKNGRESHSREGGKTSKQVT